VKTADAQKEEGQRLFHLPHLPIGYPASGVIYGKTDWLNPGIVWLTDWEETKYQNGRRTFQITGRHNAAKFQVQ
jgi:hypothetical protein